MAIGPTTGSIVPLERSQKREARVGEPSPSSAPPMASNYTLDEPLSDEPSATGAKRDTNGGVSSPCGFRRESRFATSRRR